MNFYAKTLNEIKALLGLQPVVLAEATLEDGVTVVSAEAFEAGQLIYVVDAEGNKSPAPEGVHITQDGTKVTVETMDGESKIVSVEAPEPVEEEVEVEAEVETVEATLEAEVPAETTDAIEIKATVTACLEAVSAIAKQLNTVREEMAALKSETEKLSKTPASTKIKTFEGTITPETVNPVDIRVQNLLKLREENFFNKNK